MRRTPVTFVACLIAVVVALALSFLRFDQLRAQAKNVATTGTAPGANRVLHFPAGESLGVVLLCTYFPDMDTRGPHLKVASGSGTVSIPVPSGKYIMFEANRRVFEKPSLLADISPQGIDALKLGFISMDDREDGMCDRAMAQIPHFTDLTGLEVDRSEASDKGLSYIAGLKKLRWISCLHSDAAGDFFKFLPGLPAFDELNCSWCAIDMKNLAYLPRVKTLAQLDLSRTGLNEAGMRELAKCSELRTLRIATNPKVNDESLKQLLSLKKLAWLDLRGTFVTMRGVRQLKSLPLKKLAVPTQLGGKEEMIELRRMFPKAYIVANYGAAVTDDVKKTYAPLR